MTSYCMLNRQTSCYTLLYQTKVPSINRRKYQVWLYPLQEGTTVVTRCCDAS